MLSRCDARRLSLKWPWSTRIRMEKVATTSSLEYTQEIEFDDQNKLHESTELAKTQEYETWRRQWMNGPGKACDKERPGEVVPARPKPPTQAF